MTTQMRMWAESIIPELDAVVGPKRTREITQEVTRRMGDGGLMPEWIKTMAAVIGEGGDKAEEAAFVRGFESFMQRIRPN